MSTSHFGQGDLIGRLQAALADRYAIEREVGAGGMATVYLARDLKHNRKVALKVLRPELAAVLGTERFLAEIRVTANLQHPHLLPLFDSGEADSQLFYVMPYVAGESLRARLDRERQLPVDEAVRIAAAVASALDYAHRQGVIHRDLKPENILLHDGQPLVADFGIALAVSNAGGARITQTGLSLGTPQYMSPEQATGDAFVGPAADMYALGCVLYEMLAGEPPFAGPSAQAVLAKIITETPVPLTRHRRNVPVNVAAVVAKALEKVPADRFRSGADFARALGDRAFHGESGARARWRPFALGALAATFTGAALAIAFMPRAGTAGPRSVVELTLSDSVTVANPPNGTVVAMSRDGSRIAFAGGWRGVLGINVRDLDGLAIGRLKGTEAPQPNGPQFSPDGSSILFFDNRGTRLRKISVAGGVAVTVADSTSVHGASWGDDGQVVFTRGGTTLWRVPAKGATPALLARPDSARGHVAYRWPYVLPGAKTALITLWKGDAGVLDNAELGAVNLADGEVTELGIPGTSPRYADGQLLFARADGTLLAAPFSLRRLRATGAAVPVAEGVAVRTTGGADFALSETGALVYIAGLPSGDRYEPVWVTRDGTVTEIAPGWIVQGTAAVMHSALSPDNTRLALTFRGPGGTHDIWIKRLDTGVLSRFTTAGNVNMRASWSPRGDSLAFLRSDTTASPMGSSAFLRARADGTGAAATVMDKRTLGLAETGKDLWEAFYSPDGRWIVYRVGATPFRRHIDIFALRVGVDSVGTPLLASEFAEIFPALSPDGRWIAYASDETGRQEVYVRPFPDVNGGKWPISTAGGNNPRWAHSGRELFYVSGEANGNREMIAAQVETRPTFAVGRQTALFRFEGLGFLYDVTKDDERFVTLRAASTNGAPRLILVQNLFE